MSSAYLTVAQVADELGFSPRTVLRWIDAGHLDAVRLPGGQLRIPQSAYSSFLTRHSVAPRERMVAVGARCRSGAAMRARFAGGQIDRRVIPEWPQPPSENVWAERAPEGKIVTHLPDADDQPAAGRSGGFDRYRLVAETPDDALYQFVERG